MAEHDDDVSQVVSSINDIRIGMFTTLDEHGKLVSRPLVAQEVKGDGNLWFFTARGTSQVSQIALNPRVNVAFSSRSAWVSVSGEAEVIDDLSKSRELWNPVVEAWFPEGPDTPGLVLIRVDSDSAEYWDTPGGVVTTALQWVKSRVTGQRIEAGESHTVEL
ncbi:MAG: putative ral stress protein [Cryobacterium sp.]|jgi:general stress protein 26|nr:putative ral stress protein [Cryobacterium sp.]